jgi:hypothetical protein
MSQEVLTVLEGHPCRAQASAKGVPQVVHPCLSKARRSLSAELLRVPLRRSPPGLNPPGIAEVPDPIPPPLAVLPGEDMQGMLPADLFEYRLGDIVENAERARTVMRRLLIYDAGNEYILSTPFDQLDTPEGGQAVFRNLKREEGRPPGCQLCLWGLLGERRELPSHWAGFCVLGTLSVSQRLRKLDAPERSLVRGCHGSIVGLFLCLLRATPTEAYRPCQP